MRWAWLYEMVTGDLPFKADTTFGYMHKHVYEQPEPPNLVLSDLPTAAGDVILRALAKTPEERYPSMHTLLEAFGMRSTTITARRRDPPVARTPLP